jgi:hypothetical protein
MTREKEMGKREVWRLLVARRDGIDGDRVCGGKAVYYD